MSRKSTTKSSPHDALELLMDDHKKVTQLFDEFEQLKRDDEEDNESRQALVERACTELTMHAQIEEEFFYPALRDVLDDTAALDEAEVEHTIANQLIAELELMEPGDALYDAKFTVLGEYVRHHIDEEQETIFPKAKKAKMDLAALGDHMRQRKEELRKEFGLPEGDMEDADDGSQPSSRKRSSRNARL